MARKATTKTIDFEKSIQKLEELVNTLEKGELSLEDSLKHFEEGIKLTRDCQTALQKAEQKISVLSKEDEKWKETALDKEDMLDDD